MPSGSGAGAAGSAPPGYTPPTRRPTDSSYYDFDGVPWNEEDPNSQAWMYAREARQQQAGAPTRRTRPYPSYYGNWERLPFSTSNPGIVLKPGHGPNWLHHPLTPGRTTTWTGKCGIPPGGVRSFYTPTDPSQFDVAYHNKKAGLSKNGHGKMTLADYHAAKMPAPPPPPQSQQQRRAP